MATLVAMGFKDWLFATTELTQSSASEDLVEGRQIAWIDPSTLRLPAVSGFDSLVTTYTAESLPGLFEAVNMISDAVMSLPWAAYRGDERLEIQPALIRKPNPFEPRQITIQRIAASMLLHGQAFGLLGAPDSRGVPSSYIPIPNESAGAVQVAWDDRNPLIRVFNFRGRQMSLGDDLLWLPLQLIDVVPWGVGPLQMCGRTINGAIAQDEYARNFYTEGGVPDGTLNTEGKLTKDEAQTLRDQYVENRAGKRGPLVLERGLSFQQTAVSNVDAQFLESRQFSVGDIARMFRIPGTLLEAQQSGSSLRYQNDVSVWIQFVRTAIEPVTERIEAWFSDLLPAGTDVRFDTSRLLKADVMTRFAAYESALSNGWMTVHEVRKAEGMGEPMGELKDPMAAMSVGSDTEEMHS